MAEQSVTHHTFTIERRYPVPVSRVFTSWRDPSTKRRWFTGDDGEHALDFQVGGLETVQSVGANGQRLAFESRFLDIVDDQRIVYSSTLTADGTLATASITSVELRADGGATVLTLTESGVFLDSRERPAWREQGTNDWLTRLGEEFSPATD